METMRKSLGTDRSPLSKAAGLFSASVSPEQPEQVVVDQEVIREVPAGAMAQKAVAGSNGSSPLIQVAGRKVISTASVSLEVETVQEAVDQVRTIAESVGGFVEHLTSGGGPMRQRATITIRVPQTDFSGVLLRIEGLGTVHDTTQGSEDVSERFIDLKARLGSALLEEKSMLALLEKANAVSEVLAIERELARVRSEIERFQGQLDFLERRIALATITVTLFLPEERFPEPPSASLSVEVSDVNGSVEAAKQLAMSLNGAVDRVVTTVRKDTTHSTLSVRVFTADFRQMADFLEGAGEVSQKELTEGAVATGAGVSAAQRPDANIQVTFFNQGSNTALIWTIAIMALLAVGALLAAASYRVGSRRNRIASNAPPPAEEGAEG